MLRFKRKKLKSPVPFFRLFPNMLTLGGLIIGVSSLRFALDDLWKEAIYCIITAIIIDGIDGRVARILNATSHFGAELDSLCDFVNFGLCPALITYMWSFQHYEFKLLSWCANSLYIVCMAIRLARFNTGITEDGTSQNKEEGKFFVGIPAPAGALLVLLPIILDLGVSSLFNDFEFRNYTFIIDVYIIIIGLLLASRIPTISLKKIFIPPEYLAITMIFVGIITITTFSYPWYVLPVTGVAYLLSIPYCMYLQHKHKGE